MMKYERIDAFNMRRFKLQWTCSLNPGYWKMNRCSKCVISNFTYGPSHQAEIDIKYWKFVWNTEMRSCHGFGSRCCGECTHRWLVWLLLVCRPKITPHAAWITRFLHRVPDASLELFHEYRSLYIVHSMHHFHRHINLVSFFNFGRLYTSHNSICSGISK